MSVKLLKAEAQANFLRYQPGQKRGHYESYFIRANHPSQARAFWIRYTLFSPKGQSEAAMGELWAVYFDERFGPKSAKAEFPLHHCKLADSHFNLEIGPDSHINSVEAKGQAMQISWDLKYESKESPLFFLPLNFYELPFPKAKSLVPQPFAFFNGNINVEGEPIAIENWRGSQNHNWGEKHTDYYAWGQVAGFDNAPDSFLELITAKIKLGPIKTPFMTILVLRHKGKEYRLNKIKHWISSKAKFKYFKWKFEAENKEVKVRGTIYAPQELFAGLRYPNPPGGEKYCLNTKLAACEITIKEKTKLGLREDLHTEYGAAFEILTDDKQSHGVEILF
jgi:hypothetical protein